MLISNRKHLAIIQEIRKYWSNELDRMRRENQRLNAKNGMLETENNVLKEQLGQRERPLPAPLPAVQQPTFAIVHVRNDKLLETFCGERVVTLPALSGPHLKHRVAPSRTQQLGEGESWCADCLG